MGRKRGKIPGFGHFRVTETPKHLVMKFEKKNPQHAANVDGEIKRRKGGRPPTPKTSTVAAVAGWTGVHVRIRNGCLSQDEQEEGAAALHGHAARCRP